jgi:hypothetical protein
MEFYLDLKKALMLFGFLVGLAIIVAAIALAFIAVHTATIRRELLKMRVNWDMELRPRLHKPIISAQVITRATAAARSSETASQADT